MKIRRVQKNWLHITTVSDVIIFPLTEIRAEDLMAFFIVPCPVDERVKDQLLQAVSKIS